MGGTTQHGLTQTPFNADMFDWAMQQGTPGPTCLDQWGNIGRCPQNQGNDLHMIPGRWYYMETHLKLGTGNKDGLVEFWQDDCGVDGLGCTGPGTLRLRHAGLSFSNAAKGCCNYHQENWCPTGSMGCAGEVYRDQTVWATRRIGPMGAGSTPTPTPTPTASCDVNKDSTVNVVDVQLSVNQALGVVACASDINKDGICNVIDVQRVVNAALGGACVSP